MIHFNRIVSFQNGLTHYRMVSLYVRLLLVASMYTCIPFLSCLSLFAIAYILHRFFWHLPRGTLLRAPQSLPKGEGIRSILQDLHSEDFLSTRSRINLTMQDEPRLNISVRRGRIGIDGYRRLQHPDDTEVHIKLEKGKAALEFVIDGFEKATGRREEALIFVHGYNSSLYGSTITLGQVRWFC